jgi:hypothetical protein
MATLDDVFAKIKEFNEILKTNQSYGTLDTEVRYVRLRIMEQVYNLSNYVSVPSTAQGWQIYRIDGAEQLAQYLHTKMVDIINTIDQISLSDFKVLKGKSPFVKGTEIL